MWLWTGFTTVVIQQDILRLEIPVDYPFGVQYLHRANQLLEEQPDGILRKSTRGVDQERDGAHFAMPAPEDHGEGAGADQVLGIVLVVAEDLHLSGPTGGLYRRAGLRGLPTTRGRIARDRGSMMITSAPRRRRRLLQNDTTLSNVTQSQLPVPSAPKRIYISSIIVLNRGVASNYRCPQSAPPTVKKQHDTSVARSGRGDGHVRKHRNTPRRGDTYSPPMC
ncbi:hypothetical protein DBV15_08244 [Temnothorax longispinosus]|uniref:Uncharacterized protein n=1 Tax=Temnothorax longispinosus TaxID=300112 RepID=A0A4S2KN83_9HYME|nr:hypothetical protein DBV15_08244 [Temnothorax longispinosus]